MLQFQNYLPDMELHYFLSNNPAEIIEEMQKQSKKTTNDRLKWINSQKNGVELKKFIDIYNNKLENQEFGGKIENNTAKYAGAAREFTEQYLGEIYSLSRFLEV